ncbi:phosphoribosylformylglycinamidine synthase, partial [Blastocystis sp. ATCC 50177/Nand II]
RARRWCRCTRGCPDISLTVTPDIKHAGRSSLVFVDLSGGHARLGGSAQAQTFKQLGDMKPDCDTALLKRAFRATQRVLLAGHDRSDGGLLTRVLEMCLGGDCGCVMEATTENSVME